MREADLDEELERLQQKLPAWLGRAVTWLLQPSSRWVRIPAAVLLVAGGIAGFLPVLGFWMIPLGLALVAQDVPPLRRPMARALRWINRRWKPRDDDRAGGPREAGSVSPGKAASMPSTR